MPTSSRVVRVFLSSTFRDFTAERDILVKRVFPELRRFCRERFVELIEVDLRWGITAEQAERGEVLPICLKEISRCKPADELESALPYFVGMLGERYGWVPPPESRAFAPELLKEQPWLLEHIGGASVTELEILHGVLRNQRMVGRAFFYFRDPAHAQTREGPARADFISQSDEERTRLNNLKNAILARRADYTVRENYPDPETLGKILLDDLRDAVARAFPLDEVPDSHARESLDHQVFLESRTRAYVPLEGLFDRLDAWLIPPQPPETDSETPRVPPPSRPLIVRGESGGGKSALLAAWFSRLDSRPHDAYPAPAFRFIHFVGGTPSSAHASSLLRRLLEDIRRAGAAPTGARLATDLHGLRTQLPVWLQTLSERGGGLVVLDALNQLSNPLERNLDWWPERWPDNIRVVVSSLPGDTMRAMELRGWPVAANTVVVEPLKPQQRRKVASEYLALFKKELEPRLLNTVLEAPQTRNPLFLRTVLEELRVRSTHDNLESHLKDLLQAHGPADLFVRVLKNLELDFETEGETIVHRLFEIMGRARRGLSESELLELLSRAERPAESPVPRGKLAPVFLALEDSLVSRDGQLSFFHDYLRQAVEREYLDEEHERTEADAMLAAPLVRWRDQAYGPSLTQYGHEHGIHHLLARDETPGAPLARPENLDTAVSLLLDPECREAGAEELTNSEALVNSLVLAREALAREQVDKLETGLRLATLTLAEPSRLRGHLMGKLEAAARVADWPLVARIADAEPDTDSRLLVALRALRAGTTMAADPDWIAKLGRSASETSSADEWKTLLKLKERNLS
jgi:hypothetical protein